MAKDVLSKLETKVTSSVLDKFKRKIGGRRVVRAGMWLTLLISTKNVNDIIKIVESPGKSDLLIVGAA